MVLMTQHVLHMTQCIPSSIYILNWRGSFKLCRVSFTSCWIVAYVWWDPSTCIMLHYSALTTYFQIPLETDPSVKKIVRGQWFSLTHSTPYVCACMHISGIILFYKKNNNNTIFRQIILNFTDFFLIICR